jgi:hypothetical protein
MFLLPLDATERIAYLSHSRRLLRQLDLFGDYLA